MNKSPRIFLTRRLPPQTMRRLDESATLLSVDLDRPLRPEELAEGIRDADGLICLLTDKIDGELLDANPDLKVVSNYAVGFNNIDLQAATERHVAVTNTPDVLTDCTADMAWALLMTSARRVLEGDRLVRSGQWSGWGPLQLLGTEVTGSTLGLVGFGRIAQAVAQRAKAFQMRILYWNRTRLSPQREAELGVEYRELDELLPECDFVSIHVALCDQTRHLISAPQFAAMKSSATLINTARGAVVDEEALVAALQRSDIAAAALDVYEHEPEVQAPLLEMDNVVLAPHLGSATINTRTKMGNLALENCLAACRGERPPNLVNTDWTAR
ncbi:D-glycerate dehydrogenase [Roseiconus nitratireducens]|uniref:D-glycerate dehydrogenase n=1 Tax=Roseiconus nitratireducens TaxID=2605748 RepID=A0A5M6DIP0_9BACT|nr:D-glycerate dehydrogenase [Roseiconus nitratireducens]KAA5546082.1 D-glycerate dehydrogenase [Roseiconus nitratireducens]